MLSLGKLLVNQLQVVKRTYTPLIPQHVERSLPSYNRSQSRLPPRRVEHGVMAIIWIRVEGRLLHLYRASFRVVFSARNIRFVVGGSGTIRAFPRHSYSDLDRRFLRGGFRVHAPAGGGKTVRSSSTGNIRGFGSVFQRRLIHLPSEMRD